MRKVPREVIVGIVDAIVVLMGYIVGLLVPEQKELIMFVVLALQPVAIALLVYFFAEDVAEKIAAKLR
jgi:hypothetical protein